MTVAETQIDNANDEPPGRQKRVLRMAKALRATWRPPLIAGFLLLILIIAVLIAARFFLPSSTTTTFISRVQFTFPNAETGRYPNETRFTINELLDPAILDQVYNQLRINQYGVQRDVFYSAFSIRPFSPTEQEIADSFRQQLADRRMSFAERERLEQQLRNRLEQASRGAAELSFTLPGKLSLPPEVGRAVVQAVPRIWSQMAIQRKGVLRIQGFSGSDKVVAEGPLDKRTLPLGILSLLEASHRLDDRLAEMLKAPGISTVNDPQSGKSFRDLEWDIREHQLFQINPLRAVLATYAFPGAETQLRDIMQQRISQLEILEANATRQAQAVGESLAQFVQATAGLNRGASERRGVDQAAGGNPTIPQVSEGFIDRVIELTRASLSAAQYQIFITDRTIAQFELNRRAIEYKGEQNRWKELLAAIPSKGSDATEPDEATLSHLIKQLRSASDETNAKWASLSRMESEFAANRISRTAEIYVPFVTGSDIIRFDPILNRGTLAASLSIMLIFCFALWGLLAASYMKRNV